MYNTAYCGDDRCGGRHCADGDRLRRSSRFDAGAAAFVWCGYGVRPIDVHLYCADGFACVEFRRKTNFRFIALPIAIFSLSSIVMINLIKSLDLRLIGAAFGAFLLALSIYYLLSIGGADSDKPGRHRVYPAGQGGRHAACQTAQRRSDQAGNLSFCRHFGRNDAA